MLGTFSSRLATCGLVLAACSISVFAASPASPDSRGSSALADGNILPMHFTLLTEGPASACGRTCRQLISASGMITADTPREFLAFVRDNAPQAGNPDVTVILESDGGSVLGAIDFGRAIRRLGYSTSVGRVTERRPKDAAKYGEVNTRVDCQSMCTFALLGGVQRRVPPDARVLVHQIWLGDRRDDAVAASYSAEDLVVVQRDIGSIVQYTMDMGGTAELVALSLKVPPWEPMRVLTRDELRRTRLDMTDQTETVVAIKTAAGPALADDDPPHPVAEGGGWLAVTRSGQPAVARTHPLTFEGERIGSFDLLVACGPTADTYTLTYKEKRVGPADRGPPRNLSQIAVAIGDQLQPLKITSAEKKARRGELDSVASTVLPARLVRLLAVDGPASMTMETESIGNPRTVIRVGNAGFAHNFRDVDKSCSQPPRARTDIHAQVDTVRPERLNAAMR